MAESDDLGRKNEALRHRGTDVGSFFRADRADGVAFTGGDGEVLALFAPRAAPAIANARAIDRDVPIGRLRRRLAGLRRRRLGALARAGPNRRRAARANVLPDCRD